MLELNKVYKSFKDTEAVHDLSFSIQEGETYGVLGPNGAGKTTTLRMIAGILRPDKGTILFQDELLQTTHQAQIGYLPEERGLYPKMSVLDQLIYFSQLKGVSKSEAERNAKKWLERFGLESQQHRQSSALSKGNQQKLQLIVSLCHNPKLLILDEPFSGLDLINIDELLGIINELKTSGVTLVISSHLLDQVEPLCDTITFLNHGKPLVQGKVKEIKTKFAGTDEWFMQAEPLEQAKLFFQQCKDLDFWEIQNRTIRFRLTPEKNIQSLLAELSNEIEITRLEKKAPTLKDIVLQALAKSP